MDVLFLETYHGLTNRIITRKLWYNRLGANWRCLYDRILCRFMQPIRGNADFYYFFLALALATFRCSSFLVIKFYALAIKLNSFPSKFLLIENRFLIQILVYNRYSIFGSKWICMRIENGSAKTVLYVWFQWNYSNVLNESRQL